MSLPGRKAEYDSLAFAVIAVIFISLIFWIVSMSTDIALVVSPQTVNTCLGGFERVRLAAVTQAQKSMKQMQKLKAASGLKTSRKNIDLDSRSDDIAAVDPNAFSSAINPMIAISKSTSSRAPTSEKIDENILEGASDDVKAYVSKINAEAAELRAKLGMIRAPSLPAEEEEQVEEKTRSTRSGGGRNQRVGFEPTGSDSASTSTPIVSKLPLPPPSGPPPKLASLSSHLPPPPFSQSTRVTIEEKEMKESKTAKTKETLSELPKMTSESSLTASVTKTSSPSSAEEATALPSQPTETTKVLPPPPTSAPPLMPPPSTSPPPILPPPPPPSTVPASLPSPSSTTTPTEAKEQDSSTEKVNLREKILEKKKSSARRDPIENEEI